MTTAQIAQMLTDGGYVAEVLSSTRVRVSLKGRKVWATNVSRDYPTLNCSQDGNSVIIRTLPYTAR